MRFFLFSLVIFASCSGARAAETFTPEQSKAIEAIVRNYLITNPEVMRDVGAALEKKEGEEQSAAQKQVVSDNANLLQNGKHAVIGNPNGDVTLVEFFDYNCGYCRSEESNLRELIKEDPQLRVVIKELPVLGSASVEAALVSAQLFDNPKYAQFRTALLQIKGPANKETALGVAKTLGLDTAKLETGLKDKSARPAIEETYKLATVLQINGTPGYVVGNDVLLGAVGLDVLRASIKKVRDEKSKVEENKKL